MTNREMKAEIVALGESLGVAVDTERMNGPALTELLATLRAQATAREAGIEVVPEDVVGVDESDLSEEEPEDLSQVPPTSLVGASKRLAAGSEPPEAPEVEPAVETPAAVTEEPAIEVPPPALVPGTRYHVSQGCVVYGVRGKIGAFKPIRAHDVGGEEAFAVLVQAGQVTSTKDRKRRILATAPKVR